jgi:aminoglycoside phosphotransferase (APT) family kinase protein
MDAQDIFAARFGDLVGRGAQAAVYARDNVAVKVYNAGYPKEYVFYEAAVMGFVEATGIPMSKPYEVLNVDGQMCLKMSRVTGHSVYDVMAGEPDRKTELMDDLVRLQMDIHAQQILLPVPLKPKLKEMIAHNGHLDVARKRAILALCEEMPDGNALCHGDFRGDNVMFHDGVYWVIDWIEAAKGDPLLDVCHSYVVCALGGTELAEFYLARYCAASGAKREDVLRWLPIQAGSVYGAISDHFNAALLRLMDEQL